MDEASGDNNNNNRPPGCENCKKECTIHITQIINGQMQKIDMCDTCPKAQYMQGPLEFGFIEQLLGLGMAMQPGAVLEQMYTCDKCGYTEAQFKKTGRLGCPHCYEVFIVPKIEILQRIHHDVVHKGKVPKNLKNRDLRQMLAAHKKQLKELIRREDYEEAAKVRDEINYLTEKMGKEEESLPRKKGNRKKNSKGP